MFMAELDSATGLVGEGEEDEKAPSLPVSILVPVPSPAPSPLPHQQTSTTLECTDLTGLDDPFLTEFTDIDTLLQDTNLIHPSTPSSDSDPPSPVDCNNPFLHLSKSLSLHQDPSPSPFSVASSSSESDGLGFTFSDDMVCLDYPEATSLPPSQEVVHHDHCYSTENVVSPRKRQANDDVGLLSTGAVKKPKPIVKNERYFHRRHKNNIASQVSRAKRRSKQSSMFDRVVELENENEQMRTRVEEMTAEAARLKKLLIDRLAQ